MASEQHHKGRIREAICDRKYEVGKGSWLVQEPLALMRQQGQGSDRSLGRSHAVRASFVQPWGGRQ